MDNLVVSNIRQRPIRTLVSVAGVALGVCLVMLFTGLARGMSNDMQRRATNVHAEIIFTRPGAMQLTGSSANLSTAYVERLKQIEGVEEALPVIRYIFQGNSGFGFEQIEGVEWEPFARVNEIHMETGRPPQASDEIVIDLTKARNNKLKVGDTLKLFGDKQYRIVGIFSPESGARVKLTLGAVQEALEAPVKPPTFWSKFVIQTNRSKWQNESTRPCRETRSNSPATCLRVLKKAFLTLASFCEYWSDWRRW